MVTESNGFFTTAQLKDETNNAETLVCMLKKPRRLKVVTVTGVTCNAKSTYRKCMYLALNGPSSDGRIIQADMSEVIAWGKGLGDGLGQSIRMAEPSMNLGHYLDDEYAIPLFRRWLSMVMDQNPFAELLILSGFPRTPKQVELLNELFSDVAIIHPLVTPGISWSLRNARLLTTPGGQQRLDDAGGLGVFNTRWEAYGKSTKPALANNPKVQELKWNDSLRLRMHSIFHLLRKLANSGLDVPIKRRELRKAHGRIKDEKHPVFAEIAKIEALPSPEDQPLPTPREYYRPGIPAMSTSAQMAQRAAA